MHSSAQANCYDSKTATAAAGMLVKWVNEGGNTCIQPILAGSNASRDTVCISAGCNGLVCLRDVLDWCSDLQCLVNVGAKPQLVNGVLL